LTGRFDWDLLRKEKHSGAAGEAQLTFQGGRTQVQGASPLKLYLDSSGLPLPKLRIFLDIDHCIGKSYRGKLSHGKYWKKLGIDLHEGCWSGSMFLVRPGLKILLQECCRFAEIYLLATGNSSAPEVAQILDPDCNYLRGFWGVECLTSIGDAGANTGMVTKDLRKLGDCFHPMRSVLIDDDISNMIYQPDNGIHSEISELMKEPKKTIGEVKDKMILRCPYSEIIDGLQERMVEVNPLNEILADLRILSELEDVRPYLREKYGVAKKLENHPVALRFPIAPGDSSS
jgi:hypothetical protein